MDGELPRTRLEQLMRHRHMTVPTLKDQVAAITRQEMSERQCYRWMVGEVRSLPYAHSRAALEEIFGETVDRLFGPAHGSGRVQQAPIVQASEISVCHEQLDWQRKVIALSSMRARDFLSRTEVPNVGPETINQLSDDVRALTIRYQQEPLEVILSDMSRVQEQAFVLLEGRQKPAQTRELYLLAGVASGLMARASHDTGSPEDAMVHARAAFSAADNAGHDGLKAWVKGLQSLIAYWARRYNDSIKYAQEGSEFTNAIHNTAAVWLASGEARSLAALGRYDEAQFAVNRARDARDKVCRDDLDDLGGLCTFTLPRQLYYAAEALAWAGQEKAEQAERVALEAVDAYSQASAADRAFGDEAGTRCALAIARINRSEFEGAGAAMSDVLELPPSQRTHGIVTAVQDVYRILGGVVAETRSVRELGDSMRAFSSQPLSLPE
jgi:tetratricopeptide (TPR) repeat protein